MKFDTTHAKYDTHNVAYCTESKMLKLGPTSRLVVDETNMIAISLHKWCNPDGTNKGSFIALLALGQEEQLDPEKAKTELQNFQDIFDKNPDVIYEIQEGTLPEHVYVFKYSVNVWRPVEKKRTKWAFIDDKKPGKCDPCAIQRLLVST